MTGGTGDGILMGTNALNSGPLWRDRFDPCAMNGHQVVLGRDPVETSRYAALTALRESRRRLDVFIVDTRGCYGALAKTLGARVLALGPGGPALNPFALRCTGHGHDAAARMAGLVSLVNAMAGDGPGVKRRALVDRCLTGFYSHEFENAGGSGLLGASGYRGFLQYLRSPGGRERGGRELSALLEDFTRGPSTWLLGSGGADSLPDSSPVCFDLDGVPEDVLPVSAAVCVEAVWGLTVRDPGYRLLLVDECCAALRSPGCADVLCGVVKRARKFGLGLVSVSSDPGGFLEGGSPGGRSLLQNAAFRLALGQDPAVLDPVAEALGLSPGGREFLENASPCQGVLVDGWGEFRVSVGGCTAGEWGELARAGLC